MKKTIILLFCSAITFSGFSQSDVSGFPFGHQRQPGRFCGWSPGAGSVSGALDIRNDFNQPINVFTNTFQRMLIANGTGGVTDGRIAFGNNLNAGFTPTARLHSHLVNGNPFDYNSLKFTSATTGSGSNNGFEIGSTFAGEAFLINYNQGQTMNFYTGQNTSNTVLLRMRIYDSGSNYASGRLLLGNDILGATVPLAPQARLHLHESGPVDPSTKNIFPVIKFTNDFTGAAANDGMDIGLLTNTAFFGAPFGSANLNVFESGYPFHINTANAAGTTADRRLTVFANNNAVGNPTPSTPNGGGVAIHLNPAAPVIAPRALLHIGENVGGSFGGLGQRDWMQVGTFCGQFSDNMYIGLKVERHQNIPLLQNTDAIINWGDDGNNLTSVDNMRFIFTTNPANTSLGNANTVQGREIMRMTPQGTVGIGDYAPTGTQGPGTTNYVGATLDIDGDLRVRTVAQDNTLTEVLVRDPNDLGRVKWRSASTLGSGGSPRNGLSLDPTSTFTQFGQDVGQAADPAVLLNDREVPMFNATQSAGHNIYFNGIGHDYTERITLGNNFAVSKFLVNCAELTYGPYSISAWIQNSNHHTSAFPPFDIGIVSNVVGSSTNIGEYIITGSGQQNVGLYSTVAAPSASGYSIAGQFVAGAGSNFSTPFTSVPGVKIGIITEAPAPQGTGGLPNGNYAFIANGTAASTGGVVTVSDKNTKKDTASITNAVNILKLTHPISFKFDTSKTHGLSFPTNTQYGFVADEIEQINPNIVSDIIFPGLKDSLGNIVREEYNLKGINYTAFIPVITAAIKEQQSQIDNMSSGLGTSTDGFLTYNNNGTLANSYFSQDANGVRIEGGKTLQDLSAVNSIDINDRKLYNSAGLLKVDWENGLLFNAPASAKSLDWFNRKLYFGDGQTVSIDYMDRQIGGDEWHYDADYSANFSDRSLIDKGYADSTYAPIGSGLATGDNGLTATGNIIELGGTLQHNTTINVNNNLLRFPTPDNSAVVVGGFPNFGNPVIDNLFFRAGKLNVHSTGTSSSQQMGLMVTNGGLNQANTGIAAVAYGNTSSDPSSVNYGLQASAQGAALNYAAYFNGDVFITGSYGPSDRMLKTNITPLGDATGIIKQLNPVSFNFNTSAYPQMNFTDKKQYGLIAQDVEPVLPELVNNNVHPAQYDSAGNVVTPAVKFKGLDYEKFVPILIKGMQEQQQRIEKQDSLIQMLVSAMNTCCNNGQGIRLANPNNSSSENNNQSTANNISVELSDRNIVVLNQNVPNPFAEQTSIAYNIPANTGFAQILIYNTNGQLIKAVDIKEKGQGRLNVFANDLSSGAYTYSLFVDGKLIDTKKMIKE